MATPRGTSNTQSEYEKPEWLPSAINQVAEMMDRCLAFILIKVKHSLSSAGLKGQVMERMLDSASEGIRASMNDELDRAE